MILNLDETSFEQRVLKSEQAVLVEFGAEWCAPCKALLPVLEHVSDQLTGRVQIVTVDVDASPSLAAQYGIRNMPTMIVFKGGEPVDMTVGAGRSRTEMLKWLERYA